MDKIRYGIIGLKGAGRYHVQFANKIENIELVALSDTDEAFLNDKSKEYGVRAFKDYRDMLAAGIVDAASIATPSYLHFEMGMNCLQAGVHVLMEKPFATKVSDAEAMIKLAKEKRLKLAVMHQYRTHRSSQILKEVIESGSIGKVQRVLWTWNEFRPESYFKRDQWRTTWQHAGGGITIYQNIHDLDLICWLIGKPVTVSALIANQLHNNELEDIVSANILFENGAITSFQSSINQPKGYSVRQIAGEKGIAVLQDVKSLIQDEEDEMLFGKYENSLSYLSANSTEIHMQPEISWQVYKLPDSNPPKIPFNRFVRLAKRIKKRLYNNSSKTQKNGQQITGWPVKWKEPIGQWSVLIDFADAIIRDREPLTAAENTLPALELANGIILSALRKKAVDFPIDRDEYDQLLHELMNGKVKVPQIR